MWSAQECWPNSYPPFLLNTNIPLFEYFEPKTEKAHVPLWERLLLKTYDEAEYIKKAKHQLKKCTTDTASLRKPVTLLNCLQNTNYTLFPAGETLENSPLFHYRQLNEVPWDTEMGFNLVITSCHLVATKSSLCRCEPLLEYLLQNACIPSFTSDSNDCLMETSPQEKKERNTANHRKQSKSHPAAPPAHNALREHRCWIQTTTESHA